MGGGGGGRQKIKLCESFPHLLTELHAIPCTEPAHSTAGIL